MKNWPPFLLVLSVLFLYSPVLYGQEEFSQQATTVYTKTQSSSNLDCQVVWRDASTGRCPGVSNNLLVDDLDGDGIEEIIVPVRVVSLDVKGYWYVLKYSEERNEYYQYHLGPLYLGNISAIRLVDLDEDGKNETLVVAVLNDLFIYETTNFSLVSELEVPFTLSQLNVIDIGYEDLNGDGSKEVFTASVDKIVVLNNSLTAVEHQFDLPAGDFGFGDVNGDGASELVFTHGAVVSFDTDWNSSTLYDFKPNLDEYIYELAISLSDLDSDGREEAIVTNEANAIEVFDVESESLQRNIPTEQGIDAFLFKDVDGDGQEDVLYADSGEGHIHAVDPVTGVEIWSINNNGSGASAIALGDFDDDNDLELIWSSSCDIFSRGFLYVNQIGEEIEEWRSTSIESTHWDVEIVDFEQDGQMEIVALGRELINGSEKFVITIYDAISKDVLQRLYPRDFGYFETDVPDLEFVDYSQDGDLEIIFFGRAAGSSRESIWFFDYSNANLEYTFEFANNVLDEVGYIEILDIDQDEELEIVISDSDGIQHVDLATLEQEWSSRYTPSNIGGRMRIGNIDADSTLETVYLSRNIYAFDHTNTIRYASERDDYFSILLYDWDGDGDNEVIASTSTGEIELLDDDLTIIDTLIDLNYVICGMELADFNNDGELEFMFSGESRIHFMSMDLELFPSQIIAAGLGYQEGIAVADYDSDGTLNVILGSRMSVFEIDPTCSQCIYEVPDVDLSYPDCELSLGEIVVTAPEGSSIFINKEQLSDTITSLVPGNYGFYLETPNGCETSYTLRVREPRPTVEYTVTDDSCQEENTGSIATLIYDGIRPITVEWSNGSTDFGIDSLTAGTYLYSITDARGCIYTDAIEVVQDSIEFGLINSQPSCENSASGIAQASISYGEGPFEIYWDGELSDTLFNQQLLPGEHTLAIFAANGCSDSLSFEIAAIPLAVEVNQLMVDCNNEGTGIGSVEVIEGNSSYTFQYLGVPFSTGEFTGLSSGWHYFQVIDDVNGCAVFDSLFIEAATLDGGLSAQNISCAGLNDGELLIEIIEGAPPYQFIWNDGSQDSIRTNLAPATYQLIVTDDLGCSLVKTSMLTAPDSLMAFILSQEDDPSTVEPDGFIEISVAGGTPPYSYLWENGSTDSVRTELTNTIYSLLLEDANGCTIDTVLVLFAPPIVGPAPGETFMIFPNPAEDFIFFNLPTMGNRIQLVSLSLYNLNGQLLQQLEFQQDVVLNGSSLKLDLSRLPSSTYQVVIKYWEEQAGELIPKTLVRPIQKQ